jgi:hypothetical protein
MPGIGNLVVQVLVTAVGRIEGHGEPAGRLHDEDPGAAEHGGERVAVRRRLHMRARCGNHELGGRERRRIAGHVADRGHDLIRAQHGSGEPDHDPEQPRTARIPPQPRGDQRGATGTARARAENHRDGAEGCDRDADAQPDRTAAGRARDGNHLCSMSRIHQANITGDYGELSVPNRSR